MSSSTATTTTILRSLQLNRLPQLSSMHNLTTTKKVLIIGPPLIIGSYYLCKKIFIYWKNRHRKKSFNDQQHNYHNNNHYNYNNFVDIKSASSTAITTPDSFNKLDDSNKNDTIDADNIAHHTGSLTSILQSPLKCSNCQRKQQQQQQQQQQQKLSFKEADILEISFKNLSTIQLVKFSLDKLNLIQKVLDEMKFKQQILKEHNLDTKIDEIDNINEKLSSIIQEFESLRNDLMPLTYDQQLSMNNDNNDADDDFDDQSSYKSWTTTTSLGYWDPEPNLHFFQFYQESLQSIHNIKPPKTDRTLSTGCENYNDFLAKVNCLRQSFSLLFSNYDLRQRYIKIGEEILRILLDHSLRDSNECIKAYYSFLNFVQNEENIPTIELEIEARNIAMFSFYDIVLDYMLLESFDDLENPPTAVKSIISNQWLSASFREIALQTTVSTVMRRKRSKLIVKNGFFEHFYQILDHLSPILAWGFLGTDDNLKFKCESIKDSTQSVIKDYFSFDRCRYTYLADLCDDIRRVTEERFWELNNKLKLLNNTD